MSTKDLSSHAAFTRSWLAEVLSLAKHVETSLGGR